MRCTKGSSLFTFGTRLCPTVPRVFVLVSETEDWDSTRDDSFVSGVGETRSNALQVTLALESCYDCQESGSAIWAKVMFKNIYREEFALLRSVALRAVVLVARSSRRFVSNEFLDVFIPWTRLNMIIDNASGLQMGVYNSTANKLEAPLLQVF